jgi:hypothetical protein
VRAYPKRRDFNDQEEYAQAWCEFGPPRPGEKYSFSNTGYYSALMCAQFGSCPAEYAKAVAAEATQAQSAQPGKFVNKYDIG